MRHILFYFLLISNAVFSQEKKEANTEFWGLKEMIKQGLSAQKENKHERAIRDFKLILKIADVEFKHTEDYADLLEGYAVSSLALRKPKGLIKKYKEALRIREKLNNITKLSSIHLNISNYYQKTANYNLAKKHAIEAFDYAFELENSDLKLRTLETVLNLNLNKKNNSYFKKYVDLKNELIEKNTEINKKADRYSYLSTEKDKEISLLKKDKLNLQNKIHHQENTTFKLGVLSFFILLLGLSVFIFQKNKIKKITLASDLKDRDSKELLAAFSKKLFNVRKNLTSFGRNVDEKELNQYSFYLRELEVIEKEIKEL
ncbi:hypothetical protein H3Z83_04090 [Tenacibaculum sp. S7007]|uniref:Tetratricopeptide repeat protein n=1 Tax=Tenacibaculum pelagium TaxID=2759527 RepID=A0A839ANF2_9FLAO|nr:hypothetical protein [Tenacibaculum pelagium]MBA6155704.1 hypothetical protein [Tenacibaculum pelagium]